MADARIDAEEIIDLFRSLAASVEPLEAAHREYAGLAEGDLAPLERLAGNLAGTLRALAAVATADAIASGLPSWGIDDPQLSKHNPAARFVSEAREAAASFEAFGIYSPAEALETAEKAGLVWLATIGRHLRPANNASGEINSLLRAVRNAEGEAEAARIEVRELEEKADAKNAPRRKEAEDRWRSAVGIMGSAATSPAVFISQRKPGWLELCRLYEHNPEHRVGKTLRAMMDRDWKAMKAHSRKTIETDILLA